MEVLGATGLKDGSGRSAFADSALVFVLDGGGVDIAAGMQADLFCPCACQIQESVLLADVSGSAVLDVWRDTFASAPPTVADTITASAKPTLSTAAKSSNSTLIGWNKAIAAGDVLRVNVDSASTVKRLTLVLRVRKT